MNPQDLHDDQDVEIHVPDVPIRREDFEPGRLKLGGYRVQHVAAALVGFLTTRPELTARQQEGLQKWKYQGSWSLSHPENYEDFYKFFDIFDKIVFNGVLKGHCKIDLFFEQRCDNLRVPLGYSSTQTPGCERDPRYCLREKSILIAIWGGSSSMPGRIHGYMGILVHGMVHAFFGLYSCRENYSCDKDYQYTHSDLGHHPGWWEVDAALRIATERHRRRVYGAGFESLYLPLDSARYISMAVHNGANLPGAAELKRSNLDISSILEWRDHLRDPQTWKNSRDLEEFDKCRCLYCIKQAINCITAHWTVDNEEWCDGICKVSAISPKFFEGRLVKSNHGSYRAMAFRASPCSEPPPSIDTTQPYKTSSHTIIELADHLASPTHTFGAQLPNPRAYDKADNQCGFLSRRYEARIIQHRSNYHCSKDKSTDPKNSAHSHSASRLDEIQAR